MSITPRITAAETRGRGGLVVFVTLPPMLITGGAALATGSGYVWIVFLWCLTWFVIGMLALSPRRP